MSPFQALWRTDLRRGLAQLKGAMVLLPLLLFFVTVIRDDGAEGAAVVLAGLAIVYVVIFPAIAVRDRPDGVLAFLAGLPVPGALIARARLATAATLCLGGGAQIGIAFALVFRDELAAAHYESSIAAIFVGSWAVLTTASLLLAALLTRYGSVQAMNRIVGTSVVTLFGGTYAFDALVPDPQLLLVRVLGAPPLLLIGAIVALLAVGIGIALHLMARGIDHFVPTPDAMIM